MTYSGTVAVEAGIGLAVALVEPHEFPEEAVVEVRWCWVWLVARRHPDPVRYLVEGELAERDCGQQTHSSRTRVHRIGHLLDGTAEHVSEDLAPHVRTRAAADEPDRFEPAPGEALHRPRAASAC